MPLDEAMPVAKFNGFSAGSFSFFRDLAVNQNRAWFEANREVYETQVRAPLIALVAEVMARLAKKGMVFAGDPRRALFRINRDVRFSADKSPYKTNAGAVMTRAGGKRAPGVLYVHLGQEGGFAAAGFYGPEAPVLQRLRAGIVDDPAGWGKMVKRLAAKDLRLDETDKLAKPPRGFEASAPEIDDALKFKSWVVRHGFTQSEMSEAGLAGRIVDFAMAAAPLLNFGWAALDDGG